MKITFLSDRIIHHIILVSLLNLFTVDVYAVPLNGDFSSGLSSWSTVGAVTVDNGEAILGDGDNGCAFCSRLYQGALLGPGDYLLEFDFQNGLSESVPQGSFFDTFFASVYFTNNLATFDVDGGVFDSALALLDFDALGTTLQSGSTSSSSIAGWVHYQVAFSNSFSYLIPFFELIDLNGIAGDSTARLDNVSITAVPEPLTSTLVVSGILGLGFRRQKRQL